MKLTFRPSQIDLSELYGSGNIRMTLYSDFQPHDEVEIELDYMMLWNLYDQLRPVIRELRQRNRNL